MPLDKSADELVEEFATLFSEKIEKICNRFKTVPAYQPKMTDTLLLTKVLTTNKGQNLQRNNGDEEQEL